MQPSLVRTERICYISGIWGPKVMIINEMAGSGGDLLPYMFHAKEIGPLVTSVNLILGII